MLIMVDSKVLKAYLQPLGNTTLADIMNATKTRFKAGSVQKLASRGLSVTIRREAVQELRRSVVVDSL